MPFNIVFLWNDVRQEKAILAATASCDSVEIYYTLENRSVRPGGSATVSSQCWFPIEREEIMEEHLLLD